MRRDHILFGGIGFAALLLGLVLIPKSEEHATMLARDGLYDAALQELAVLRKSHPDNPQIVMQSHMIRTRQGDIAGAIEAMRDYLSLRPKDETARERYAELLLHSGRLEDYLSVLADLTNDIPRADRIDRLAGLYRLHGRHDEELKLLTAFAATPYAGWPHLERLGALLAARSDFEPARRWLELADEMAPAREGDVRLLLLDVLLEAGRHEEAVKRSAGWIERWRSPFLAAKAVVRIAQAGDMTAASTLASLCVDVLPEASLPLASAFSDRGYPMLARSMLAAWSVHAKEPKPGEIRDFVYASRQAGDLEGPVDLLTKLIRQNSPAAVQAALAEEMGRTFGMQLISSLHQMLPASVFDARPIFGAELALSEGNRDLARRYVDRIDPLALSADDRAVWLSQLQRLLPPGDVLSRLATLWSQGRLPSDLVRVVAEQAGQQGQSALQAAIWTSRHP